MTENAKHGSGWHQHRLRIAIWTTAALILLLPAIAMQFTDEVNWTGSDFVFAGVLLFGSIGAYEIAATRTRDTVYRAAAGVAIAAALLLTWVNAAVGITDSAADGMYLGVPAIGIIGALLTRLRPRGMARTMFATAIAQVLIAVIALAAGMVADHNSTLEIAGITGFFVTLWIGSALLFQRAAPIGTSD